MSPPPDTRSHLRDLAAALDPLLAPDTALPLLVGLLLRRHRLVVRTRPYPADDDLPTAPACWRAVGLVVEAVIHRPEGNRPGVHPVDARLVHLVDRSGRSLTRLAEPGRAPRTALQGNGPLDELCRSILGLSPRS